MDFERYTFDAEELDGKQVFSNVATSLGIMVLGVAAGMKLMATFLLQQFCLTSLGLQGPSLLGGGCTEAQRIATEYTLNSLGIGVVLLLVGIVSTVVWREDHE